MPFTPREIPLVARRELCECYHAEEKTTKSKDDAVLLFFKEVATGDKIGTDFVSFGQSALNIAKRKMRGLGMRKEGEPLGEIDANQFRGRRAYITWKVERDKFNDEDVLKPDIGAKGTLAGYEPESAGEPAVERSISHPDAKPPVEDEATIDSGGEVPF